LAIIDLLTCRLATIRPKVIPAARNLSAPPVPCLSMDFFYAVVPVLLVLAAVIIVWLSLRRSRALHTSSHSSARKITERIGLSLLCLVVLILAGSSGINAVLLHRARAVMPGQLYIVDGRPMRLDCMGSGSPTLVLDSGAGNDGLVWGGVQPVLAQTTRVCSYDRAGMGWSDSVPPPRDADHIADQLHGLLAAAGVNGPIVLMGHSIAGIYIRDYAARYPPQVAGLIFVDGSTPWQNRDPAFKSEMQSMPWPLRVARVAMVQGAFVLGVPRWLGHCTRGFRNLPPDVATLAAESRCHVIASSLLGEIKSFDRSSDETIHTTFGDLPILVLSSDPARTLADHQPQAMVDAWSRMQSNLAHLSTRGRRIIATGSPHYIMLERPDLVEREVPLFIQQIRGSAPWPAFGTTITE
jgi:pimeloyl-ACP methyl ester carboxylesterase